MRDIRAMAPHIVRFCGTLIGAFAIVLLLSKSGVFGFRGSLGAVQVFFDEVILGLPLNALSLGLVEPVLSGFQAMGWGLPAMEGLWRPVFVILALIFMSMSHPLRPRWAFSMLGLSGALVAAVCAGMLPGLAARAGLGLSLDAFVLMGFLMLLVALSLHMLIAAMPRKYSRYSPYALLCLTAVALLGYGVGQTAPPPADGFTIYVPVSGDPATEFVTMEASLSVASACILAVSWVLGWAASWQSTNSGWHIPDTRVLQDAGLALALASMLVLISLM
jgi:hypothetical protein